MSGAAKSLLDGAEIIQLDPNTIDISGRIGFYHEDKAVAFGRLIAVDGQRDPIKVSRHKAGAALPWRLHVGLHRTMGTRIESLPVHAIVVKGTPEQLRDLEASENLHRRPLGPIERAKFTAALVQAAQERLARQHGNLSHQTLGAKARWERVKAGETRAEEALRDEADDACDKMSQAYGWAESVGAALDIGKREIYRDLSLFRLLIEPFPDLAEALSKHPVVGENASQLKEIAKVQSEAKRRAVIEALLADREIGADHARIIAGVDRPAGPAPMPHQKHYSAIEGGWSRLGTAEKRQFLPKIVTMMPDGMKRELRDMLNAELGE